MLYTKTTKNQQQQTSISTRQKLSASGLENKGTNLTSSTLWSHQNEQKKVRFAIQSELNHFEYTEATNLCFGHVEEFF